MVSSISASSASEAAVEAYLARHPARVRYWTTGEIGAAG
jgi:glycine betaine/proline transport system substrate-binding protein